MKMYEIGTPKEKAEVPINYTKWPLTKYQDLAVTCGIWIIKMLYHSGCYPIINDS